MIIQGLRKQGGQNFGPFVTSDHNNTYGFYSKTIDTCSEIKHTCTISVAVCKKQQLLMFGCEVFSFDRQNCYCPTNPDYN